MEHSFTVCPNCLEPLGGAAVCGHCGFDAGSYVVLPHHLVPGTLIKQRYQVGRVLGEGGFGITYAGRDTVLNLKIAIKEFYMAGYVNRNHEASPDVFATLGTHRDTFHKNKEKFLSEARVLARFYEEPGIVGVRDFCEENGTAYIIMDFLDGVTLKDYLEKNGRLAPAEAIHLLLPVIRSLQHVHAGGVIHRDISPDNIMVLGDGRTKLLDFGAAREVSQTDIKSLSVILKPGYAPEEQYRSKGRQGPWTDVYALAATLYRCIVGEAPDDAMERMYRDQLPAPADTAAACPPAISRVIMKGLAVRQPDRYQDIPAFLQDLEAALANPEDPAIAAQAPAARPAGERGVPAGGQTGPAGGDRTVLADLETGCTVLADLPAQSEETARPAAAPAPAEPKAEPAPEPEPEPKPAPQPSYAPKARPQPEQSAAPAEPAPKAEPAPQSAPAAPETPAAPEKTGKKKPPVAALAAVAAVAVVAVVGAAVFGPKGGSPAAPAAASSSPAVSGSAPADSGATSSAGSAASGDTAAENSADGSNAVSATTGEITLTDTVEGGEDSQVYRSFILNGVQMELPAALSSFYDQGWVLEDESLEGTQLAPSEELNSVNLINEYGSIQITVENQTQLTQPINNCTVTHLVVASTDLNDNYLDEIGNIFQMGEGVGIDSPQKQALDLYPGSKIDEFGDLVYDSDNIRLMISEYQGNISFYALTVYDLVPKWLDVNAHVTGEPAEYSDAAFMQQYGLSGFTFTIDGNEYADPFTIQKFVDNGWTLEKGPDTLPSMQSAIFYLRKDVRTTMQIIGINFTANGIDPVYSLAYGIVIGGEESSSVNLVDPGAQISYQGTKFAALGDSKADVDAAAQAAGLIATMTDDGTATIYTANADTPIGVAICWDDTGCADWLGVGTSADTLSISQYYYE